MSLTLNGSTGIVTANIADNAITTNKIVDASVSTNKIVDASVSLPKMYNGYKNGVTEIDQWRLTVGFTSASNGGASVITGNLARVNTRGFGQLGTGMTESSGTFTFPSTGYWRIDFNWQGRQQNSVTPYYVGGGIKTCTDGSTYDWATETLQANNRNQDYSSGHSVFIFKVQNTTTHKCQFWYECSEWMYMTGSGSYNTTYFTFEKLGDL